MNHLPKHNPINRCRLQPRRKGFSTVEMIVSLILLGVVAGMVVPALAWMGVQNRLSTQRQEAVESLHNLMDELTTRPYAELTAQVGEKSALSTELQSQLPGARLKIEIEETEPRAKRIHVELSWNQHNGQPLAPVRLTAWVHQREGNP